MQLVIQNFRNNNLKILTLLCIAIIFAFSFNTIVLRRESYLISSAQNLEISNYINAPRGEIYDRNGKLLARNELTIEFYADKQNEEMLRFYSAMQKIYQTDNTLDISELSIEADKVIFRIKFNQFDRFYEIREQNNFYNSINSKILLKRIYDYPYQTSHIIGYTGVASQEDLNAGYRLNSIVGKAGLESQLEDFIKGTDGLITNSNGSNIILKPVQGRDFKLSIDIDWQNQIYELLEKYNNIYDAAGGAGVIIDLSDHSVAALVSYPGYDINKFSNGISADELNSIINSRSQPLIDKSFRSSYTPGSIFKIATSQALIESGYITDDSYYFSNRCMKIGQSDFCEFDRNFYGWMDLKRAIYTSSNMFFCNYILEAQNNGEVKNILDLIQNEFDITKNTGIDLQAEVEGKIGIELYPDRWFQGESCNFVIGQGRVQVTPIRMAVLVGELVSGKKITPNIILDYKDEFTIQSSSISEHTRNMVLQGMSLVARDLGSSVSRFYRRIPNWLVAKTGSAETFENINGTLVDRTNSWIIGAFEYKDRKYSFAFFQRFGGGGFYLAPIVADFLNYINSR